jgi:hypothetical protein
MALDRERIIPTERPLLVGEVSANFCGYRVVLTMVVMNSTILWDTEATEEVGFETHNYFVI